MTNVGFGRIEDYRDIESLNHYRHAVEAGADPEAVLAGIRPVSRDNARTPMQWDASPGAGFTTGEPWLAVNPNHSEINAEAARADERSVFHHYRRLVELRHRSDVVVHGDFRLLVPADEQVFAYTRSLDGTTLLVVANMSSERAEVELEGCAGLLAGESLLSTHDDGAPASGERLALAPWESRVLLHR